ncbi:MAG TPA: type I pullulanase [Mesotoga infera]|jgi:pullulanase|nr:type I pullulanase [Mesotoga infera]
MRRVLFILAILLGTTIMAFTGESMGKTAADYGAETVLIIHYHRYSGNYDGWNLWVWPNMPTSMDGKSYIFDRSDEFGVVSTVKFSNKHTRLGYIVRLNDWQAKDVNADRFVDIPESGVAEIWLIEGEYDHVTDPASIDLRPRIKAAFLDSLNEIYVSLSAPVDTKVAEAKVLIKNEQRPVKSIEKADPTDISFTNYVKVTLAGTIEPEEISDPIELVIEGFLPDEVIVRSALDDPSFYYEGQLGAIYERDFTTFRVWSPVSSSATLLLYDDYDSQKCKQISMTKTSQGVWEATVEGDLHLKSYRYSLFSYGKFRETVDIYSKAVTRNSLRSVVIDPARTVFDEWEMDVRPSMEKFEDAIIYEIHISDITADTKTNVVNRGKYLGLTERDRTGPEGVKAGLDHLIELGVTHVHILPFNDIHYIDEGIDGQYGWGYDPYLYMVPEGHYSTDPSNPLSRIIEAKMMIKALHDSGIRVILDTVYNHTASTGEGSPFDQTVPYYYYRTDRTGAYTNGSGVGNEIATERPMMRKHIIDSLKMWVNDYHIDGFRFDLLGLFDRETVLAIDRELHELEPTLLLYGEPWGGWGANVTFSKGDQKGTQVAVFNDNLRDAIRGSVFDPKVKGFSLGSRAKERRIMRGISGSIEYSYDIRDFTDDPAETINYVSAHDNQTLWDKNSAAMPDASQELLLNAQKLSNAIVLLSQGIPFLHGGVDFARTKNGNDNSYNAGVELNKMDYSRKAQFIDLFNYYKGMIELRKSHPAFRMATAQEIKENLVFLDTPRNIVAFILNGEATGDTWKEILVIFNGNIEDAKITLPNGSWNLAMDEARVSKESLGEIKGEVILRAASAYVLYK